MSKSFLHFSFFVLHPGWVLPFHLTLMLSTYCTLHQHVLSVIITLTDALIKALSGQEVVPLLQTNRIRSLDHFPLCFLKLFFYYLGATPQATAQETPPLGRQMINMIVRSLICLCVCVCALLMVAGVPVQIFPLSLGANNISEVYLKVKLITYSLTFSPEKAFLEGDL